MPAVETYLDAIGAPLGDDLFSGDDRADPVKPSTVTTRMYTLRRLCWGAVQGGIPIESLTSLRPVTTPAFAKASLNWHFRRAGEVNADLAQMAATIASVAQYLKLSEAEWAALKPILAKAKPPPRTELTEHTSQLLDQLADPTCRLKLLHLPQHLMREATRIGDGLPNRSGKVRPPQPEAAAWLAATAVAIEILLHAPMRLINLQTLRLGTELQLSQVSRKQYRGTIFLAAASVKNTRRLEVPLQSETIALIRTYLDRHRPLLPCPDSPWLFPGQGGPDRPRHKGAFGQAITEAVEQWVGIRLNPHAFRAFAGAMILEANPHAIDDVRAILGHSCFETAMIYYRRCCQRDAANRLSATIAGERSSTRLNAAVHFQGRDLRRQPGRAR
jgi:integrase